MPTWAMRIIQFLVFAMTNDVLSVFRMRSIPQVGQRIIHPVAIGVAHFHAILTWADKSKHDQAVNRIHSRLIAWTMQADNPVAISHHI